MRPLNGSYNNLYGIDEGDGELDNGGVEAEMENRGPSEPHGDRMDPAAEGDHPRGHLYSNLADSHYMNHHLDLDPVVLTGAHLLIKN